MICRVIRAYGPWPAGHIFTEMPGNVGRTLIARGLVEEVSPDERQFSPPVDRMMRSAPVKKQASVRK